MRALVTGATGFIGGALAQRLLAQGWQVHVLARRPDSASSLAARGASVFVGDVTRLDTIRPAFKGVNVVFHCAAVVDLVKPDRAAMVQANVEGTRNVLQAASEARVGRVVHLSSVAAIGNRFPTVDETRFNDGAYDR